MGGVRNTAINSTYGVGSEIYKLNITYRRLVRPLIERRPTLGHAGRRLGQRTGAREVREAEPAEI